MVHQAQVEISHYRFDKYMHKRRWASLWHQIDEILKKNIKSVLEVGPGSRLLATILQSYGISVETADIDAQLEPTYILENSVLPLKDSSVDCVCAFQVLEHMPYEISLKLFKEMARVSREVLILSLPDAKKMYRLSIDLPFVDKLSIIIPRPRIKVRKNYFNGEHYWEINREGYPLGKIIEDLSLIAKLDYTYRVKENPYHRFFVFRKL